jgi:hypothetical protein
LDDMLRAERPAATGAMSDFHSAANAAADAAADDSGAVRQAAESWREDLQRRITRGGIEPEEGEFLVAIRRLAARATDADPFAALYDAVAERAAMAYKEAWPASELQVTSLIEHPRGSVTGDPYALTAHTPPGIPAVVDLLIDPDGLGSATWAALPSVLVHECVCHVPARQGDEVMNTSPFAEGLTDWAASWFFGVWIAAIDADLAPAAREHAPTLVQLFTNPATPEGAARRRGRRAASRWAAWAANTDGFGQTAADAHVAASIVSLNVTEAPLADKDLLVTQLNAAGWDEALEEKLLSVLRHQAPPADLL